MIDATTARRAAGLRFGRYPLPCLLVLLLSVLSGSAGAVDEADALPHGFVYLDDMIPDLRLTCARLGG